MTLPFPRALRAALLLSALILHAENWPEFRGPGGQGHSSEKNLPETWSESTNIAWKTALPGTGWSSPVVVDGRIWVTAAVDGKSMRLLELDAATGKLTRDTEVFAHEAAKKIHAKNSHASPTPIVSGERIYVHYGSQGTACVRKDGSVIWKTQFDYDHVHGNGGSPILANGLLHINCDGGDQQYAVALDAETGKVRWKSDRKTYMSFATSLMAKTPQGEQLISPTAHRTIAYDPATGKELWWVTYGDGFSNVPRPVYGHGMVFLDSGFMTPAVLGVRTDGRGDVTNSHVAWTVQRGAPHTPSLLLVGDELYFVSDKGIATCVDARTGKIHWQERIGGNHSASPTLANGRIYFLSEEGESVVIKPGKEFNKVASNQLDGRFLASPAISDGAIYLRSQSHLYKVKK